MTNTILSQRNIDLIKQDCLYSRVYDRYKGTDRLEEALRNSGYIEEPRSEMDALALNDMRFLTMPIRHAGSVFDDGPHAVLVSTGSYSPVHAGHIDIMNKARDDPRLGLGVNIVSANSLGTGFSVGGRGPVLRSSATEPAWGWHVSGYKRRCHPGRVTVRSGWPFPSRSPIPRADSRR